MVVVQAYFPDSEYVKTEKRCGNYFFELGVLAASAPSGSSCSSWKPGKVPPKPAHALVRHPKRLLPFLVYRSSISPPPSAVNYVAAYELLRFAVRAQGHPTTPHSVPICA